MGHSSLALRGAEGWGANSADHLYDLFTMFEKAAGLADGLIKADVNQRTAK
jgi:hypothetical protein